MPLSTYQLRGFSAYLLCLAAVLSFLSTAHAAYQDDIGLYDLRARDASLTGSGVTVAQIEAQQKDTDNYQTDPANAGLSSSLFTYYDSTNTWSGGGAGFDSSRESSHANTVGSRFFGIPSGTQGVDGVAPGVALIEVFEAEHYYNDLVRLGTATNAAVVNQSFVFGSQDATIDSNYDNYASNHNVLFVNGITNATPATIPSPASSYNGIAVNVAGDSVSPLADGRSKPDISAPGSTFTSYVTPLVSGAAAILIQSALREDGGTGTASAASDIRTIKALLLNGATKPKGWTHSSTRPLDADDGSGVLEINEAQLQLAAGQYSPTQDEVLTEAGTAHLPPSGETGNIASYSGWNLGSVTNTAESSGPRGNRKQYDVTDHYFFELSSSDASAFYLTSTLVWNRQSGRSNINNLDLFLYQADGTLIASSISSVDNVEHIYARHLAPGRYVLQVHKPYNSGRITNGETYALAFDFRPAPTPGTPGNVSATALSSSAIDLSWTDTSDDETGYRVERRPSGGSYSTIATLGADSTAYSDSGLASGTTYDYRITAFNAEAESSGTASATTHSPPAAPASATATTISASAIDLSWSDNSNNESGFLIERRVSGGSYSTVATLGVNTTSYGDTGLLDDTTYEYRISAFNAAGSSSAVTASATTYTKVEDWRLTFFGTTSNSGDAADTFDYDLDGLKNLIEFVTGSDPTTFSPSPINTSLLGTNGEISFDWRVDSGYNFSIGYTTDLTIGFSYYDSATLDSGSSPELEHVGTDGPVDGFETRSYRVRDSVTAPNVFLRLLVN